MVQAKLKLTHAENTINRVDRIDTVDELYRIKSLFEGANILLVEGYDDKMSTDAVQTIIWVAMQRLSALIKNMEERNRAARSVKEVA